jgi:hypothetical protein
MVWGRMTQDRIRKTQYETMYNDLPEGLIMGATIGLLVVAIRMLFVGASAWQALALVLAGVILCAGQVVLSVRRVRRAARPSAMRPAAARPRRLSRHNPFAQELTHNWTGLDDRFTEGDREPRTENQEPTNDER